MQRAQAIIFFALLTILGINCFTVLRPSRSYCKISMTLDETTISKLEEIRGKYDRLAAVVSPEAEAERAQLSEVAEKYATYREIKQMMAKLRTMWRTEASERRREKQLKSFASLFEGRLELEESLKQKLGLPFQKIVTKPKEYDEVLKLSQEVEALEKKLNDVSLTIPAGMSTREERFGALP